MSSEGAGLVAPGRSGIIRAGGSGLPWLILANAYLLSPVLFFELQVSKGLAARPDKLALFALPVSLLSLLCFQLFVRRQLVAHLILMPFYLLVAIDLFIVRHYDARLTSSMIVLIVENSGDTPSFLRFNAAKILPAVAALVVAYAGLLWAIRDLRLEARRSGRLTAVAALLIVYLLVVAKQAHALGAHASWPEVALDVVSHDRNSPFGVVPQGYIAYRVYQDARSHQNDAASFSFGARRMKAPPGREIYLLVIGESSRKDHWGLYGYGRNTTPLLAAEKELVVFRDAITQAALTQISVPLMLTRASLSTMGHVVPEKSVLSAFKEVGFRTFWFSTQQRDQWTGAINRYPAEANVTRFYERRHDERLVEEVEDTLRSNKDWAKLFLVLHTQGSHFVFADRYPPRFRIFGSGPAAARGAEDIDTYDNSIVNTDYVLEQLIGLLRKEDATTALLYVADHGENLRDDSRQLWGHFLNNEYDLPIPMVFWPSREYSRQFSGKLDAARGNAGRRINTTVVFHSLLDMAGISVDGDRASVKSVFRSTLREEPRLIPRGRELVDYDEQWGKNGVVGNASAQPR